MKNKKTTHNFHFTGIIFLLALLVVAVASISTGQLAQAQEGFPPPNNPDGETMEKSSRTPLGDPVLPQATGGPDAYGYQWDDTQTYSWIDVTGDTDAGLLGDEAFVGPISLGFNFPFYENAYNQVYISSNGLLTFGAGSRDSLNRIMPFPAEPQNMIAPFWSDLKLTSSANGKVYYSSGANRFVVSFHNIEKFGETGTATFQVILQKDGDICFQYKEFSFPTLDDATIGIENSDGTDGLTYLHNAAGVTDLVGANKLCFNHPPDSYRVKVTPTYAGQFVTADRAVFNLNITNIGDLGPDSYDIEVVSSSPGWEMEFVKANGVALVDSNNDGKVELNNILVDTTISLRAYLYAPENAEVGDNTSVSVAVISTGDNTKQRVVELVGAVPSPFVQGLVVGETISLLMIWEQDIAFPVVSPEYTGSTIGVTYLDGDRYLNLWEQNEDFYDNGKLLSTADLKYAVLDGYGSPQLGPGDITNNADDSSLDYQVRDRFPVAAANDNGKVGIAWSRSIWDDVAKQEQSNIFFAIYNSNDFSAPIVGPINVTQNSKWESTDVTNVPIYTKPKIALTASNDFVIVWQDYRRQISGLTVVDDFNVGLAVYTQAGQKTYSTNKIAGLTSTPGNVVYQEPNVLGLGNGNIFVSYSQSDLDDFTKEIGYTVLKANGSTVAAPKLIAGVQGEISNLMQFNNGTILVNWIGVDDEQIYFATVGSGSGYPVKSGPTKLKTPEGFTANLSSVLEDTLGNAVVTWIDQELEQHIYYALVDSDGNVVVPPVEFYDSRGETMTVSKLGASTAAYVGKNRLFLPLVEE